MDDDRDIAEVVQPILLDEGCRVSCLYTPDAAEVKATVEALAPSAVLLDGGEPSAYGPSWDIATWLTEREPAIPTLMLTGHVHEQEDAVRDDERAHLARVAGIVPKPFDIDRLISALRRVVGDTPWAGRDRVISLVRVVKDPGRAGGWRDRLPVRRMDLRLRPRRGTFEYSR